MALVRYLPQNVVVEAKLGETLFDVGGRVSAGIDTACVGKGTCGLCRLKIVAGNDQLTPFTDEEYRHLGNVFHITKVRLSCRARLVESESDSEIVVEVVPKRKKRI